MQRQKFSHKVVADCMEALIGAYYVAGGEMGASAYMRHIGLLPKMPSTAYQLSEIDRSADSPSARYFLPPLVYATPCTSPKLFCIVTIVICTAGL